MDSVWGADAGSLQGYTRPRNIVQGTWPQLILFLVFQMWASHLGLPLLLAITVFSKHVKRDATFINLCLAFIIIGISSSLLVYGQALRGPEPPPMLCLLQASLLYGMPTLTSGAACMLVVQMFLRIRAAHHGKRYEDDDYPIRRWAMLGFPYIVYFIPVLATAVIGARNPERVGRDRRFFYCSLDCLPLTNGICIFSAIILLGTVALIVSAIVLLVRQRKVRSNLRVSLDLSLPIRVMAFGLYLIAAMSISLLSVWSPSSPVPDLVIASAATVVILIFGTQADIIRVLCFWKRRRVVPIKVDVAAVVDLKSAFEGDSTDNKPKTVYGLKPGV